MARCIARKKSLTPRIHTTMGSSASPADAAPCRHQQCPALSSRRRRNSRARHRRQPPRRLRPRRGRPHKVARRGARGGLQRRRRSAAFAVLPVESANYARDVSQWADAVALGSGVYNGNAAPAILSFVNSWDVDDARLGRCSAAAARHGRRRGGRAPAGARGAQPCAPHLRRDAGGRRVVAKRRGHRLGGGGRRPPVANASLQLARAHGLRLATAAAAMKRGRATLASAASAAATDAVGARRSRRAARLGRALVGADQRQSDPGGARRGARDRQLHGGVWRRPGRPEEPHGVRRRVHRAHALRPRARVHRRAGLPRLGVHGAHDRRRRRRAGVRGVRLPVLRARHERLVHARPEGAGDHFAWDAPYYGSVGGETLTMWRGTARGRGADEGGFALTTDARLPRRRHARARQRLEHPLWVATKARIDNFVPTAPDSAFDVPPTCHLPRAVAGYQAVRCMPI